MISIAGGVQVPFLGEACSLGRKSYGLDQLNSIESEDMTMVHLLLQAVCTSQSFYPILFRFMPNLKGPETVLAKPALWMVGQNNS